MFPFICGQLKCCLPMHLSNGICYVSVYLASFMFPPLNTSIHSLIIMSPSLSNHLPAPSHCAWGEKNGTLKSHRTFSVKIFKKTYAAANGSLSQLESTVYSKAARRSFWNHVRRFSLSAISFKNTDWNWPEFSPPTLARTPLFPA